MTPRILIIAGSDSGGGAGIQADVKTVTMLGGHAMTAITALTAQNTVGVDAIQPVSPDFVVAQIDACLNDIGADAIKIGMLGSVEVAHAVADRLADVKLPIVFDPVMVATSGAELADDATIEAFDRLLRLATIATPNLPELAEMASGEDEIGAALALVAARGCAVLIKGGHGEEDPIADVLVETDNITTWQGSRIDTRHSHGTGCTLASAIAVYLARGATLPQAVDRARDFVRHALRSAPGLGQGAGPMGHQDVRLDTGEPMRLNQVTLPCRDYDASVDFYLRLGLTQIVDSPSNGYARFEAPGGVTLSIHREDGAVGATTLYFEVEALDELVLALSRDGVHFEHPPIDQPWLWREARLRDPAGNMICLYRAGENRRFPPWRV
ncbi:MAG TPA: bifunctional hydroxymethylpyrimidine kinase/phosphomethylpyrimidine kinase [Sphingomonas sp.]|jgi:hydroxymethylpyrimidine/phosphomethylpyrimidine kinase|nr:bifunctional hydroxymethylpyrimidine kinase/phosphomethylpyrimidine kinase [Sphingomonas sp.]